MVMNPRTHKRGAPPDFTLPKPNPNPSRMTDALWWLVCMREALEPALSDNGGTYANKPGYHNIGNNLPDFGLGNIKTDHSIRRGPDRSGPWWETKTSAHDWTFRDAQAGNYATITKYTKRLISAMKDPDDPRPDNVFAYTLGQVDNDRVVEGYNEYTDDAETSGDTSHNWHRHDSLRRNIIGHFSAMWQALTIDMGWTVAEWRESIGLATGSEPVQMIAIDGELPLLKQGMSDPVDKSGTYWITRAQKLLGIPADGDYGPNTASAVKALMIQDPKRTTTNGSQIGESEWRKLYGIWG